MEKEDQQEGGKGSRSPNRSQGKSKLVLSKGFLVPEAPLPGPRSFSSGTLMALWWASLLSFVLLHIVIALCGDPLGEALLFSREPLLLQHLRLGCLSLCRGW